LLKEESRRQLPEVVLCGPVLSPEAKHLASFSGGVKQSAQVM